MIRDIRVMDYELYDKIIKSATKYHERRFFEF
jgi:hypothetical protein